MTFATIDELLDAGERDLGVTAWHTITQEHVQKFADATDAHEWIHVDVDRAAREGPFGTTVAHGYLTLALATPFITALLGLEGRAVGVNYGLERVRFPAPVRVGSRVRGRGSLRQARRQGDAVRTVVGLVVEVEGLDRPACVADVVSLIIPSRR